MKVTKFKAFYEELGKIDIANSKTLNTNMWVWFSLTERQLLKVYELMVIRGSEVLRDEDNKEFILLKNGTRIYK